MTPPVPKGLCDQAAQWELLHRWERSELGKALRQIGLTYGEIQELVPVPKGTLSNWCRDIQLTDAQIEAITSRTGPGSRAGIPVDTQCRRREEIAAIRSEARAFGVSHLNDSFFVAGVALYWGEGSKTKRSLELSNSDPAALHLFVCWVRHYFDHNAAFTLALHLHEGNDEKAAMRFWRDAVGLPDARFTKTFTKPAGTGHRKNHLQHGVCRIRVRRSTDYWIRTMVWIEIARRQPWPLHRSA